MLVSRAEAARILGVSDAAVGRIRAGSYPSGDVVARYELLVAVLERAASSADAQAYCRTCPREDCAGCRIAELDEG